MESGTTCHLLTYDERSARSASFNSLLFYYYYSLFSLFFIIILTIIELSRQHKIHSTNLAQNRSTICLLINDGYTIFLFIHIVN